jgi:ubiquinone/menaquinone biosynthesis C-methylase UbiE
MLEIRLDEIETDSQSQDAYETIYATSDISQRDSFYLWLVDLFGLKPDDVYLDISCGRGQLPALARERGIRAHGIDLSHTALKSAANESHRKNLVTANSQTLPYAANNFTIVSNIGSIEHYVDMPTALREMVRVLKPGGRAYILVPNTFSLLHNIWIAFREGRTNIDSQPIQRYAARKEWQNLLEESGLEVVGTVKYEIEVPYTAKDWASYLRHPKRLIRLMLVPLVPLNLAFCFLFICRKVG